jgi:DNA-binding NtrC family response regulator
MSRLRVVPIVEGHGEAGCVRILLDRIWREMLGGEYIEVARPIRWASGRLVTKEGIQEAVRVAVKSVNRLPTTTDPTLLLILIDAGENCPGRLGPELLAHAQELDSRMDVACVFAKVEYETWFAAAAESLTRYLELPPDFVASALPEEARHAKGWVERHFRGTRYSETQDQPAMTSAMDLAVCRRRSPSFDKLCRELERRLRRVERSG